MNGIAKCRKKCDLRRDSKGVKRAYCVGGILPSTCQDCCEHKDTGCYCDKLCMKSVAICERECPVMNTKERTYCTDLGKGWENIPGRAPIPRECIECCPGCKNVESNEEVEVDATCRPSCMENYLTCREKCSWNSDGSVVKCDDGHLPLLCKNKCCNTDPCPEQIACTTECTLKKWSTFYQECLEDYSEEIKEKCVMICKAEAEQECTSSRCISSPDDCEPLMDCQSSCCREYGEEYFKKCREEYDEDEVALECVEECVESRRG
eukprot:scaffold37079_cov40-Cyclotella_meneghiniana.AAC.3